MEEKKKYFNLLANSYALSLIVINQVPWLKFCMYFSFPVDPPVSYGYITNTTVGRAEFFTSCTSTTSGLTVQQLQTTKEHLIPLQHRNSPRRNSSELAVDLPVRYNNVLLTGPLSSNKGDGCRTVRTMHLPEFFLRSRLRANPPLWRAHRTSGLPFQMFIRCKMGFERIQSHTTMVTPFAETKHAAVLSHNNSLGIRHAGIYCTFNANNFFARLYDVTNVLMTKTCLTVLSVGVADFTKAGAHPSGRGLAGCNAPNPPEPK